LNLDYISDWSEIPNFTNNKAKKFDELVSKFKEGINSDIYKDRKDGEEASRTNKRIFLLDHTNNCDSSVNVNEKSTFINTKSKFPNFNNTIDTNFDINNNNYLYFNNKNDYNNNNNNNRNRSNKQNRNYEMEQKKNDEREFDLRIAHDILETEMQVKNIVKAVKTEQLINEKEDENINKIKNQILSNISLLNLLQDQSLNKKAKTGTFEEKNEEEVFDNNNNDNNKKEINSEKREQEGIELKFNNKEKYVRKLKQSEIKEK